MFTLKKGVRGKRTLFVGVMLFLMFFLSNQSMYFPDSAVSENSIGSIPLDSPTSDSLGENLPELDFNIAEHSDSGSLDPITIEKVGYSTSGTLSARTDTDPSVSYDLPLDDVHGWVASQAEVSITNLNRLYVVNGTFSDGIAGQDFLNDSMPINYYPYGWNATGYNPAGANQFQLSAYDDSGSGFVIAENQGVKIGGSGKQYDHIAGTEVVWYQLIDNTPYTEDFYLNLNYLLSRGPLGSGVFGEGRLFAMVDGTVIWNTSIPDIPSRGTWYSVDNLPITLTGAGSVLNFSIGFIIDSTFDLNADADNDGDGYADGIANTFYLTTWFDDISFVGQSSPDFQAVDLQFSAGASTTPITGAAGIGSVAISNSTNWNTNPVHTSISSNASVSFDYEAKLLSHRYTDSNSATSASALGVNYQVSPDTSPDLSFYTYLGSLGEYQNLNISVEHPYDWENATIWDPQSADVTSQCILSQGSILIPTDLLVDGLGWWFISIQSPNYGKSLLSQVYDSNGDQWTSETTFRSGNISRATTSIGFGSSVPNPLNSVNFTWIMPNETVWYQESVSGGVSGKINSTALTFGATNSTAGVWKVYALWQNDTEIALSEVQFEIRHISSLSAADPSIDTETGVVVTAFVNYIDAENGEFLMDSSAIMTANWSASTIIFQPNEGRNQWEADFDTSLLPPGFYLVVVNVTQTYFDVASCTFTISSNRTGNMLNLGETTTDLDLRQTYPLSMRFEDRFGSGIEGASFTFEIVSGMPGGITWGSVGGGIGGDYSVDLFSVYSGRYEITITAWKDHYEADQDTLFLFVGDLNSSLTFLNESIQAIQFGEDFELFLEYTNDTGHGLDGAEVTVVNPPSALLVSETQNLTGGIYSITFTPTLSEPFTILIQASITNHKTQIDSFTLTVTPISSNLELNFTASTISFDQQCIIHLNLTSSLLGPLAGAEIQAFVNPSTGLSFSDYEDLGGGIYRINATPDDIGIYSLNFLAKAANHVDSINAFTLHVVPITTEVVGAGPIDALFYGRSRSFTYEYRTWSSQIGIQGTTNSTSGVGADWLTLVPLGSGLFNISVVPENVGSFSVTVVIGKSGYQSQNFTFSFLVQAIPITVHLDPPSWTERQPLNLTVILTDDLGSPVTGAEVQYEVFRGVSSVALGEMDEVSDGVYSVIVNHFPIIGQRHDVHIVVSKDNHETIGGTYESVIVLLESQEGLFIRLWENYGIPAVIAFAAVGVVGASYRIRSKRRDAYMAKALAVKRRFDDANNFIGIVILHKTSGLPVYSNILKGGFEEGMISAFITAITHFRSEFDRDDYDLSFEVLPISDIIRAVPTRNLVCAFITVSSASMQQEARMIEFAKGVSKLMDDDSAERPTEVNNTVIMELLEKFFDEVMDGFLLRYYKRGKTGAFPKRYRCLEDALNFTEAADCSRPAYLAIVMSERCKITEAEASLLVLEAIETDLIVPCSKHEVISFAPAHRDDGKDLPEGPVSM
ncbi:MAG: hypothetical protein ACXADD_17310 [Candidatus Thorarchaeota archaeon]|jgi:hypothetical protein